MANAKPTPEPHVWQTIDKIAEELHLKREVTIADQNYSYIPITLEDVTRAGLTGVTGVEQEGAAKHLRKYLRRKDLGVSIDETTYLFVDSLPKEVELGYVSAHLVPYLQDKHEQNPTKATIRSALEKRLQAIISTAQKSPQEANAWDKLVLSGTQNEVQTDLVGGFPSVLQCWPWIESQEGITLSEHFLPLIEGNEKLEQQQFLQEGGEMYARVGADEDDKTLHAVFIPRVAYMPNKHFLVRKGIGELNDPVPDLAMHLAMHQPREVLKLSILLEDKGTKQEKQAFKEAVANGFYTLATGNWRDESGINYESTQRIPGGRLKQLALNLQRAESVSKDVRDLLLARFQETSEIEAITTLQNELYLDVKKSGPEQVQLLSEEEPPMEVFAKKVLQELEGVVEGILDTYLTEIIQKTLKKQNKLMMGPAGNYLIKGVQYKKKSDDSYFKLNELLGIHSNPGALGPVEKLFFAAHTIQYKHAQYVIKACGVDKTTELKPFYIPSDADGKRLREAIVNGSYIIGEERARQRWLESRMETESEWPRYCRSSLVARMGIRIDEGQTNKDRLVLAYQKGNATVRRSRTIKQPKITVQKHVLPVIHHLLGIQKEAKKYVT